MKYISICSGIEAASTAWHGLGWTPLAFSEIEPFPSAVLAQRYPEVPNLGDMSKFREWPEELLAECELLVGGTPCQAFSVAGLRKSLDDERGNLSLIYVQMFHHINAIRRKHGRSPAIALWENVPGVLSTKDNAFGCFISGLLGVDDTLETQDGKWPKAGFLGSETVRVGYRVLDAQYFAVAQRRRRVFLVAVPCELIASVGERACPSEILSLRESVLGNPPTRGETRQAVAGGSAGCAAGGGEPYHLDRAMFNQGVNAQYEPQITDDGVAASMVARGPAAVMWNASDQANAERLVDQAGTLNCNKGQRGGWIAPSGHPDPAYAISAGNQSKGGVFGSGRDSQDTFVVGVSSLAVRTAQTSANGHGVAEEVAHTLDQVQGQAVATPIDLRQASRGEKVTNNRSSGSGGPPGSGVGDAGDPAFTVSERGQAVAFKPSHYTRGKDGKPDEVAPPLSADADKGDQDTVIMRQSIGFNWQNGGGYGNANDGLGITEEGTGPLSRSQVPACVTGARTHALTTRAAAVEEDGTGRGTPIIPVGGEPQTFDWQASDGGQDTSFRGGSRAYIVDKPGCSRSLTSCKTLAVAFSAKDSGSDATEELSPTMRAMQHVDGNANAGGQIAVAFTKAKRAQSVNDDESWVPGEVAPTQNQFDVGDTRATTVVAFTQNSRDEVRQIDGDGQIAGALSAEAGMHQTNYLAFAPLQGGRSMPVTPESPTLEAGTGNKAPAVLAFANRTRDGVKVPEIMKDGVTPALTNPGDGGRADAVNVLADAPVQVQWASGGGKVENPTMQALRTSAEHSYQFVRQAMQVRRLTPTECCRLQGFPDDHCDIIFRKKPAADGPKYRALGNSMAVPCMAWLGYRIHLATRQDS
jgi:DNA (cytosine-5)-methyltransferase 1